MSAKKPSIPGNPELMDETLLPIAEAPEAFPVKVSSRWIDQIISQGSRGVRLETLLIGTRRYTSKEAIRRFITRTQGTPKAKQKTPVVRIDPAETKRLLKQFNLPEPGDCGPR
jgi:hypothetical protein